MVEAANNRQNEALELLQGRTARTEALARAQTEAHDLLLGRTAKAETQATALTESLQDSRQCAGEALNLLEETATQTARRLEERAAKLLTEALKPLQERTAQTEALARTQTEALELLQRRTARAEGEAAALTARVHS